MSRTSLALVGQLDAHRAAVDADALMVEEAHLDELLQIVGDVGAEVVAARAQFARGQLLVADVVEQQRLHRIDVGAAAAIEFVLDDVEQPAMQPLDQRQSFQIERPDVVETRFAFGRLDRLGNGFHVQRPLFCLVFRPGNEALFPRPRCHTLKGAV